jgi:hypothetical protein
MNNAKESTNRVRIRLAMTGPPWVSEEFQWKWAHEKLGVLRVMAGLSRQHTTDAGTIFCRQFVVTHIFETFHVSRRKNGKNAAKTGILD